METNTDVYICTILRDMNADKSINKALAIQGQEIVTLRLSIHVSYNREIKLLAIKTPGIYLIKSTFKLPNMGLITC